MQCSIAPLDLVARLSGTICMYDNVPYYISVDDMTANPTKIFLHDLLSKRWMKEIDYKDPKFDIATPPLGYLQVKKDRVVWSERMPHRQYKQGLTPAVVHYGYFSEAFRCQFHTEYFRDMMMHKYLDFDGVLKSVLSDVPYGEYALSNDVALVKVLSGVVKIYFKHEEVAYSSVSKLGKKKPVIHVPPSSKSWIAEKNLQNFDWSISND